MKTIDCDIKTLVAAILAVCPKVPIKFISNWEIVFKGVFLQIRNGEVCSDRINFTFNNPEGFLDQLIQNGLMLKTREKTSIIAKYYIECM